MARVDRGRHPIEDLRARREARRLEEDLADLGVSRPIGAGFLGDVLYALTPPVHERRIPLFGAATWAPHEVRLGTHWVDVPLPLPPPAGFSRLWSPGDLDVARRASDGLTSFLFRSSGGELSVITSDMLASELNLSRLQRQTGMAFVQRSGDGKVRLYLREMIAVHEKNRWSAKPYSHEMAWPLPDMVRRDAARAVLEMAVHVLGAGNVGATFVMPTTTRVIDGSNALDMEGVTHVDPLPIEDPGAFLALRNVASQVDRAIALDAAGNVVGTNVTLRTEGSDKATSGGTRHNSAIRASDVDGTLLLFVVSEDGPVSVFHGGRRIASFTTAEWSRVCTPCRGTGWIRLPRSQASLFGTPSTETPSFGQAVLLVESQPVKVDPDPEEVEDEIECETCQGTGRVWSTGPVNRMLRQRRPRYAYTA